MRSRNNWYDQMVNTPDKKAKLHMYITYAQIISWVMVVIGVILFILIVTGIIQS